MSNVRHLAEDVRLESVKAKQLPPPAVAELLVSLVASPHFREAMLGDMQEMFEHSVRRHGHEKAVTLYWTHALLSACVLFFHRFVRPIVSRRRVNS